MNNVLKVKFTKSYLTKENIDYLCQTFETELKTDDMEGILNQLTGNAFLSSNNTEDVGNCLLTLIEFMSEENIPWPYTEIPIDLFFRCDDLIEVEIPSHVKSIGDNAFFSCFFLQKVSLPEGIESIGENAFLNCATLPTIDLPDSIKNIGVAAFRLCNLLKNIHIPLHLTCIRKECFTNCSHIDNIIIPEGIEILEQDCFSWCSQLYNITLPKSLKEIRTQAFAARFTGQTFYYNSTYEDWKKIKKYSNWTTSKDFVICTDGKFPA